MMIGSMRGMPRADSHRARFSGIVLLCESEVRQDWLALECCLRDGCGAKLCLNEATRPLLGTEIPLSVALYLEVNSQKQAVPK